MTITRLSNVDAAWLKMEDPTNLMMVTGVMTFNQKLDFGQFRALIENRLLQFDRFRQRVIRPSMPFTPPYWEFDPLFDLNAHVHRLALPHPHNKMALQEMVSYLMSTALDFTKPLWQMHVVEGYGDGSALIVRLHHCMADGMALVGVLLALTDLSPAPSAAEPNGHLANELVAINGRDASLQALRETGMRVGLERVHQRGELFGFLLPECPVDVGLLARQGDQQHALAAGQQGDAAVGMHHHGSPQITQVLELVGEAVVEAPVVAGGFGEGLHALDMAGVVPDHAGFDFHQRAAFQARHDGHGFQRVAQCLGFHASARVRANWAVR